MYYTSALSFYFSVNMINISTGVILPSLDLVSQKVGTVARDVFPACYFLPRINKDFKVFFFGGGGRGGNEISTELCLLGEQAK
jgi:hypothetical protein